MIDWHAQFEEHYATQPSPHAPSLSNRDYGRAVKLATATRFGGYATASESELFWQSYQDMQKSLERPMSDEEFLHHLDVMAPVSFRLNGRPPKLLEIARLRDQLPARVREYFSSLPDPTFPDITAGEMMRSRTVADRYAKQHLGRPATKVEAHFFHHSGLAAGAIDDHYAQMNQGGGGNALQTAARGNPANGGATPAGVGQGMAGTEGGGPPRWTPGSRPGGPGGSPAPRAAGSPSPALA